MCKLVLFLILFLCALSPNIYAQEEDGGIDGGGGGTLPIDPASISQIQEIIQKDARRDLRLYIKAKHFEYSFLSGTGSAAEAKVFGGERTLWDVMESTDIEVRSDRPCLNAEGQERDGSIYESKPNAICISSFRIAPKVDEDQARVQVEALILHELSHLLGATEVEAKELQRDAVRSMKKWDNDASQKIVDSVVAATSDATNAFYVMMAKTAENPKITDQELLDEVSKVQSATRLIHEKDHDLLNNLSVFNKGEFDFFRIQDTRLMLLSWYLESLADTSNRGKYSGELYAKVFEADESISFAQFEQRRFGGSGIGNQWNEERIERLRNREDVMTAIKSLQGYFQELITYGNALRYDLAVTRMHGPWSSSRENPWAKFLGTFKVVSIDCDAEGKKIFGFTDLQELTVHFPDYANGKMMLRRIWTNGWGDEGAYDGGPDVSSGSAVSVDGGANFAERKAEYGTSWGDRWNVWTIRLERASGGYQLTNSYLSRDRIYHNSESQGFCRYSLEKNQ